MKEGDSPTENLNKTAEFTMAAEEANSPKWHVLPSQLNLKASHRVKETQGLITSNNASRRNSNDLDCNNESPRSAGRHSKLTFMMRSKSDHKQ